MTGAHSAFSWDDPPDGHWDRNGRPPRARLSQADVAQGRGPLRPTGTYMIEVSRDVLEELIAIEFRPAHTGGSALPRTLRFDAYDTGEGTVEIVVTRRDDWP